MASVEARADWVITSGSQGAPSTWGGTKPAGTRRAAIWVAEVSLATGAMVALQEPSAAMGVSGWPKEGLVHQASSTRR